MGRPLTWTPVEDSLLGQIFPERGAAGCVPYLPGRNADQIRYRAHVLGLISKAGLRMKDRTARKKEAPYSPSNEHERKRMEEAARLLGELHDFGHITRTGQLVATIDARWAA